MENEVSPVEFGKMIAEMQQLRREIHAHRQVCEALDFRINTLESRYTFGKYSLFGILTAAGFALFGVKETLRSIWGLVFR